MLSIKKINIDILNSMNKLKEENKSLRLKVEHLESRVNWGEQKLLENVVEIVGVPDLNKSNANERMHTIFQKALNVSVSAIDINKCYVKQIKQQHSNHNENVSCNILCVHFSSHVTKQTIMESKKTNRRNLNSSIFVEGSNTNIFINDSLTKYTRSLFMGAKKLKKEKHFK